MSFTVALFNVLLTLYYMIPGFVLCKAKKASADHLSTLSAILIYVLTPFMVISSFLNLDYAPENLGRMGLFFVATFLLQTLFILLVVLLFRRKFDLPKVRILTIGSIAGNVGFFGIPIMKALMPGAPEVVSYASVYAVSMNILAYTVGVFCLTGDRFYISLKKAFCNPTVLSLFVAVPLYVTGAKGYLPELVQNAIGLLSSMTTPLCMLILGIRLATVSLPRLFSRPLVYLTCAAKLLVFPLFCFGIVSLFPLPESFRAAVLILSGTPCASIVLNLAELHGKETELSANCVLVCTILCFLTIPVLTLFLG
ncbi:MAG: AEC family transporter [Ruminococcus sp.]|nr:AEC family transporter [Candidatus Apopatosoma intestinale]